jgi:hypothetical protein
MQEPSGSNSLQSLPAEPRGLLMDITRRQFIESAAAGVVLAPLLGALAGYTLPTQTFGKTVIEVFDCGFGSDRRSVSSSEATGTSPGVSTILAADLE